MTYKRKGGWGGKRKGAGAKAKNAVPPTASVKTMAENPQDGPAISRKIKITSTMLEEARRRTPRRVRRDNKAPFVNPFAPYVPVKGAVPHDHKIAMDAALPAISEAQGVAASWFGYDGLAFLGYPVLSEMAQRPEYRKMSERLAYETTRKWITFKSVDADDTSKDEKIKEIEDYLRDLGLREACQASVLNDGLFGRSHIYVDTGKTDDPEELKTPIGDGRDEASKLKITKGSLRQFKVVEPIWCYPATYNANDPLKDDWFRPDLWFVMGKQVHRTRLLTMVGRPVPDLLKPAYSFGGLSLTQIARPYVDNFLRNRDSASDLLNNFSKNGIKTDLQQQLSPQGGTGNDAASLMRRIDLYTEFADNEGMLVLDKDGEEFFQFNTPLGTTDVLLAQSMEMLCFVAGMPIVVLLGLSPHGLNASSEGEILAFENWVDAFRKAFFGESLRTMIELAMISRWGEVDKDIVWEWEPMRAMTDAEIEEMQAKRADRDIKYVEAGVLDPVEVRGRIARDKDSGYNSIEVDNVPEIGVEEEEPPPEEGAGEGGEPGNENQKIRESVRRKVIGSALAEGS